MKKILVLILALSLVLPATAHNQSSDNEQKLGVPCGLIIGVTVLVTGGYIAYELWQFCQRQLPPPPPAPPPPPPPPPVATNQPPTVSTNTPATNRPSARLSINSKDVQALAIEPYGYKAPDGTLYHTMIKMDLMSSTTLSTWKSLPVVAYVSASSVLTQVGNDGAVIQPFTTNWVMDLGLNDPDTPMKFIRSATP